MRLGAGAEGGGTAGGKIGQSSALKRRADWIE
jgi:hypothetical protein